MREINETPLTPLQQTRLRLLKYGYTVTDIADLQEVKSTSVDDSLKKAAQTAGLLQDTSRPRQMKLLRDLGLISLRDIIRISENLDRSLLTPRQVEAVNLYLEGLTNKEIAWEMGISLRTAECHLLSARELLQVESSGRTALLSKLLE